MKKLIISLGLIVTVFACGQNLASNPHGIFLDEQTSIPAQNTLVNGLQARFTALKACTGLPLGDLSDLTVIIKPDNFPCLDHIVCAGLFSTPNIIRTTLVYPVWEHELTHFLLFKNTGDLNINHTGGLWELCSFRNGKLHYPAKEQNNEHL